MRAIDLIWTWNGTDWRDMSPNQQARFGAALAISRAENVSIEDVFYQHQQNGSSYWTSSDTGKEYRVSRSQAINALKKWRMNPWPVTHPDTNETIHAE